MIKLHGFGGPSQFWDYNLESFTLMAGLAAVTSRIQLFATCASACHAAADRSAYGRYGPDSISHGRFGINIILSGWQRREDTCRWAFGQGAEHYRRRYDYCAEYVTVMRELWQCGSIGLQGRLLPDGRLSVPAFANSQYPHHLRGAERQRHTFRGALCRLQFLFELRREYADGCRAKRGPVGKKAAEETGRDCGCARLDHGDRR